MKPEAVGLTKKLITLEPHYTASHFSHPGVQPLFFFNLSPSRALSFKDSESTARRHGRLTLGSQVAPHTISAAERKAAPPRPRRPILTPSVV